MEDRSCIITDFRPLGAADDPNNATTTLSGVFDGHLSSKAAEMAANNLHEHLSKGETITIKKFLVRIPLDYFASRQGVW